MTANSSLRYTGNVTLVSVQLEAMLLINGLALCGSDDKNDSIARNSEPKWAVFIFVTRQHTCQPVNKASV